VIGDSAQQRWRRLDCIDPAHPPRSGLGGAAPLREGARKGEVSGRPGDRIALDCENNVGILEQGQRINPAAKSQQRAGIDRVARQRLPLMPAGTRILLQ
jgi:hypothetical protein